METIQEQIIERFNLEETNQDRQHFLNETSDVVKNLEKEQFCECGKILGTEEEQRNKICGECK